MVPLWNYGGGAEVLRGTLVTRSRPYEFGAVIAFLVYGWMGAMWVWRCYGYSLPEIRFLVMRPCPSRPLARQDVHDGHREWRALLEVREVDPEDLFTGVAYYSW